MLIACLGPPPLHELRFVRSSSTLRALLLMFLSLVYRRDPFLARCYIQCTHPLLARLRHQMFYHFYADDTQLYITFRTSSVSDMNLSNAKLVNCVRDMDAWMLSNKLKLNKDMSEVLFLSTSATTFFC